MFFPLRQETSATRTTIGDFLVWGIAFWHTAYFSLRRVQPRFGFVNALLHGGPFLQSMLFHAGQISYIIDRVHR